MASVAVASLSPAEKEQLAVSYAAFVLSGSGAEVNAASLTAVLQASGVTVSAGLLNAVAKALKGRKVSEFFGGISVGGGSSGASSAPQPAQGKAAETKAPKQ
jgi:ribosomal protein L12E/L44/L45/RPP1/RPP2